MRGICLWANRRANTRIVERYYEKFPPSLLLPSPPPRTISVSRVGWGEHPPHVLTMKGVPGFPPPVDIAMVKEVLHSSCLAIGYTVRVSAWLGDKWSEENSVFLIASHTGCEQLGHMVALPNDLATKEWLRGERLGQSPAAELLSLAGNHNVYLQCRPGSGSRRSEMKLLSLRVIHRWMSRCQAGGPEPQYVYVGKSRAQVQERAENLGQEPGKPKSARVRRLATVD